MMGPKYSLLGACCLLAVALASQRQVVVFARDVPMHYSTGHVPLTSNDNAGRGVDAVGLPGATNQSDGIPIIRIPPVHCIPPFCRRAPATAIATNP